MQLAKVVIASALILTTCAEGLPEGKCTKTAILEDWFDCVVKTLLFQDLKAICT